MKMNAAMLCLAGGLLAFPFPAYLPYWLYAMGVVVEAVLAWKITSVTTLVAAQVCVDLCVWRERDTSRPKV